MVRPSPGRTKAGLIFESGLTNSGELMKLITECESNSEAPAKSVLEDDETNATLLPGHSLTKL